MDKSFRAGRTLGGVAALLVGVALGVYGFVTLWTYVVYVRGEGTWMSRFAWRSLTMGVIEVVVASGLVWLAFHLFGSKPLRQHQPTLA